MVILSFLLLKQFLKTEFMAWIRARKSVAWYWLDVWSL